MSPHGRPGRGVRSPLTTAALVAVVGAVVLGLFGMHGLSQHGATPTHGPHPPVTATVRTDHAGHAATRHTTPIASTAPISAAAGVGTRGPVEGMAMLCAAMLLTAAAGVLLALRLRRLAHRASVGRRPVTDTLRTVLVPRAATGPPAVWEFSVARC